MHEGLLAWGVPARKLHLIPNAWADPIEVLSRDDARRVLGMDADGWYAGFVGRIGREKGPDVFIDALARTDPAISAVLIGDGRLRTQLTAHAEQIGLAERVKWAGALDDAGRLLRAFDVIVLSSRTEGTPMVLLEAMAAGVPVIATAVGGMPDVLRDDAGLLVSPEDPAAVAAALRDIRNDPAGARARAARAADRIDTDFSAATWRERYDAVYRACLNGARA